MPTDFNEKNNLTQTLARYFIRVPGSDQLRFTAVGREHLVQRFARQGIHLETIKTVPHFLRAHRMVTCAELDAIRWDKSSEPALKELLDQLLD